MIPCVLQPVLIMDRIHDLLQQFAEGHDTTIDGNAFSTNHHLINESAFTYLGRRAYNLRSKNYQL